MSPWQGLVGTPGYLAGTSGTFTVPTGAVVIAVSVHATASGSFSLFGGASVPVPAGVTVALDFKHALFQAYPGNSTIVATGTDSVFVHYVKQGHAS